ncbi:MAG: mechanosensitive ion channel family protein [Bacteroidales bacterium]|jgi:MscS family membrane protein|nr:mechanosensitive ion channel family protein [Bacteroidales bacterium]
MLDKIFYGNTLEDWGISLIIIVSALVLNKLIILLNKHVIQKITAKTSNKYDDILFKNLQTPVLLGIILLAIWISATRLSLPIKIHDFISKSYQILTVLNITWFIVKMINSLLDEYIRKTAEKNKLDNLTADNRLMPLIKRTVIFVIWAIGTVMALNNAGVSVAALLGTLGIGGIAIALAAQDTVKNIISGITLYIDRPFRIGDRIRFDTIDGYVEDIGIRSTKIRTLDKRIITLPNYKIVDTSIENVTEEPGRRIVMKLGLTYNTSPDKMKEAITILKSIPQTIQDVEPANLSAIFSDFGDSALIITFIYFINKSAIDLFETISIVNFQILTQFNQAGLDFAFPTQTIYIEQ